MLPLRGKILNVASASADKLWQNQELKDLIETLGCGVGEMPPPQLRETMMDPAKRTLLKVVARPEERAQTNELVESLMGRRPELRFAFIQERAKTVEELDV